MTRPGQAPAWWRHAVAEVSPGRSLAVETPSHGTNARREPGDVARRDFIRGEVVTSADERVRHARAVLGRMASTRGAMRVEIPDGRRGIILHALIAKRASADGAAWREVLRYSNELEGISDADALVSVVAVEVGRVPDALAVMGTRPLLVLVEVERVTIPEPARGEHDGSLERFIASKRGKHKPVDLYRRGRWDNPRMPAIPAARLEPIAKPGKLGPGARVRVSEIRPDAQTVNDRTGYEGLILARLASGDYAVQRLEDSAAGPYGSVVRLSWLCLMPTKGERGQYA